MDVIPVPVHYQLDISHYKGFESIKKLLNAKYFLLAVDEFTRRTYLIPMKAMKAEDIQRAFDDLMQEIGYDKVERLQRK